MDPLRCGAGEAGAYHPLAVLIKTIRVIIGGGQRVSGRGVTISPVRGWRVELAWSISENVWDRYFCRREWLRRPEKWREEDTHGGDERPLQESARIGVSAGVELAVGAR